MEQLSLFDIKFPIYAITKSFRKIWEEHNVLYIRTDSGTYVLDNKNMDGDTVGKRRIKITTSKLYVPRKVYYNIGQMLNGNYSIFMDTDGVVFKYKKTEFAPLVYHKIDSITEAKDGECILELPKINYSYKINCRKAYSIQYIGLLHTKFGFIAYEFSEEYKKPTRRKI